MISAYIGALDWKRAVTDEDYHAASLPVGQAVAESAAKGTGSSELAGLDAHRVSTGKFTYRILDHGKDVARLTIVVNRLADSRYVFTAEASAPYTQTWKSLATASLVPVEAALSIGQEGAKKSFMSLTYDRNHVSGSIVTQTPAIGESKVPVAATLPTATLDQRIDWAGVLASRLEPGAPFEFNVFDGGSGLGRLAGRATSLEEVRVPLGTFQAYRAVYSIKKSNGTESYALLATRDTPRMLVREEMPHGIVSELIAVASIDSKTQDHTQ
jgi:hypothetical protein